jgi:NADPH-dependent ferric siderophore reductase
MSTEHRSENPYGIHRVMHDIKRRRLEVLRVTDLTPRMRRITLGGEQLAGFLSLGADDHIKLLFATTPAEQAALATMVLGNQADDGPKPAMRDYTPRRIDLAAGELDIDFVLHGDGPAATWAAQAAPGQYLHMGGPRSSTVVPDSFESYWLIGDETALPAIARRLEALPAGRRVLAEVIWVERHHQRLTEVVRQLTPPPGTLYAWVATEAKLSRTLRRVLLDEHQVDEQALKAAGYWRLETDDETL